MNDDLQQRLERVEAHLAHVERLNEELNAVVIGQSRDLARLQTQFRRLAETLEAAEIDRIRATNPRPPHA